MSENLFRIRFRTERDDGDKRNRWKWDSGEVKISHLSTEDWVSHCFTVGVNGDLTHVEALLHENGGENGYLPS